ncbi:hypothetical protein S-CBS1_gp23 [Synechococcus phage S-CBS1]|uniref:hypothetical protein n=1 Tax=Synechococcus phage S-CBS1 TaxID=909297 RepID=UPI000231E293|nr:hypothetical protein S-CBS1_gp23 [Synechococcus phage S-CBS1]ADP06628.1 hypothetical protein S-CBS1_gp23 [Synechococcus phage S-CBS1]
MWRFSTRSDWADVQRLIDRRKFEATLKPRLDAEIEAWHKAQPEAMPPPLRLDDLHLRAPWYEPDKPDPTD